MQLVVACLCSSCSQRDGEAPRTVSNLSNSRRIPDSRYYESIPLSLQLSGSLSGDVGVLSAPRPGQAGRGSRQQAQPRAGFPAPSAVSDCPLPDGAGRTACGSPRNPAPSHPWQSSAVDYERKKNYKKIKEEMHPALRTYPL